jgi:hypothetical protein
MFSHIKIESDNIARSKKFYDALFTAMGAQPATEDALGRLAYSHSGGRFEDPPGVRANGAYLAYIRDPGGNKLVAVARRAA